MEEKLQVRKGIALQLKEHDSKTNKFRSLNRKIKKKEELTKEEIVEFNDMTKNTKLEKALQSNERVIDALIREKIEDPMYYDVFVARCRDIGEPITVEKAKYFKEEVLMLNKGNLAVINCCSMKLGINAITSLCKHAKNRKVRPAHSVAGRRQHRGQRHRRQRHARRQRPARQQLLQVAQHRLQHDLRLGHEHGPQRTHLLHLPRSARRSRASPRSASGKKASGKTPSASSAPRSSRRC